MEQTPENWEINEKVLERNFKFADFASALEFINKVGKLADSANHHPDIEFGWGRAKISLTTHDQGGVTNKDIALAKEISECYN